MKTLKINRKLFKNNKTFKKNGKIGSKKFKLIDGNQIKNVKITGNKIKKQYMARKIKDSTQVWQTNSFNKELSNIGEVDELQGILSKLKNEKARLANNSKVHHDNNNNTSSSSNTNPLTGEIINETTNNDDSFLGRLKNISETTYKIDEIEKLTGKKFKDDIEPRLAGESFSDWNDRYYASGKRWIEKYTSVLEEGDSHDAHDSHDDHHHHHEPEFFKEKNIYHKDGLSSVEIAHLIEHKYISGIVVDEDGQIPDGIKQFSDDLVPFVNGMKWYIEDLEEDPVRSRTVVIEEETGHKYIIPYPDVGLDFAAYPVTEHTNLEVPFIRQCDPEDAGIEILSDFNHKKENLNYIRRLHFKHLPQQMPWGKANRFVDHEHQTETEAYEPEFAHDMIIKPFIQRLEHRDYYFGHVPKETARRMAQYAKSDRGRKIAEWYYNYDIGKAFVYNERKPTAPASVIVQDEMGGKSLIDDENYDFRANTDPEAKKINEDAIAAEKKKKEERKEREHKERMARQQDEYVIRQQRAPEFVKQQKLLDIQQKAISTSEDYDYKIEIAKSKSEKATLESEKSIAVSKIWDEANIDEVSANFDFIKVPNQYKNKTTPKTTTTKTTKTTEKKL